MTAVLDTPAYDFTQEIAAGAALLDEKLPPDWRTCVDVDTLDLLSMTQCVLGQLFGTYEHGALALELEDVGALGFFLPQQVNRAVYGGSVDAWNTDAWWDSYIERKHAAWDALTQQWKDHLTAAV